MLLMVIIYSFIFCRHVSQEADGMTQVPQQQWLHCVCVANILNTAWGSGAALGAVITIFHHPTPMVEFYKGHPR